jgi:hypothetical protein
MTDPNPAHPRVILPALECWGPLHDALSTVEDVVKGHLPVLGDEDWLGLRLALAHHVHLLGEEWMMGVCSSDPTLAGMDAGRLVDAYAEVGEAMVALGREVRAQSIQTGDSVNRILRRKARIAARPGGDPSLPAPMLRLLRVIYRKRLADDLAIDDLTFLLVPGEETRIVHKERQWKTYCAMMLALKKKRTGDDTDPPLSLLLRLRLRWMNRHVQRISTQNPGSMGAFGGFETGSLALRRGVALVTIVTIAVLVWLLIHTAGSAPHGREENGYGRENPDVDSSFGR